MEWEMQRSVKSKKRDNAVKLHKLRHNLQREINVANIKSVARTQFIKIPVISYFL